MKGWKWARAVKAAVYALLGCACAMAATHGAAAQGPAGLPEAPGVQQAAAHGDGSISGTVVDGDGEAVAGAQVSLTGAGLASAQKVIADGEGYFSFIGLPAGGYKLTVAALGFAAAEKPLVLAAGQQMETPDVVLAVAMAMTDVEVVYSPHELAEEEMHQQERQRIAGLIPNFYTTYDWHAPPMSSKQKFSLAWRAAWDPANFVVAALIAGGEQWGDAFPGYGQGAAGYGKRYGAIVADGTVGGFLGGAIFPALLHQDPRYFYKGTGSVMSRALYALSTAVITKGDNGRWQPNYSSVLADVSTGAISNVYYPASNRNGATLTIENGLLNAGEDGLSNLLQEFVFRRVSTGVKKGP